MLKLQKLLMLTLPLLGMLSMVACSDENVPEGRPLQKFTYNERIFNNSSSMIYSLDSLGAPIVSVEGVPDWLTVTYELDSNQQPLLVVKYEAYESSEERSAQLLVTAENGNKAYFTIVQLPDVDDYTTTEEANWFTNWENIDEVFIYEDDMPTEILTPWAEEAPVKFDPSLLDSLNTRCGWEMAFSKLFNKWAPRSRYFGLYNRYLGLLRIFCYISQSDILGANQGEMSFEVFYGDNIKNALYPFYNSLVYSIPTNHSPEGTKENRLDLSVNLIDASTSRSFHDFKVPSAVTQSRVTTEGWTCIDVNLSGYMPEGVTWTDGKNIHCLDIHCLTQSRTEVSITGKLRGAMKGKFQESQIVDKSEASPSNGWGATLQRIGNDLSSFSGFAFSSMMALEDWRTGAFGCVDVLDFLSSACTAAVTLINMDDTPTPQPQLEKIPGKIDLSLNASIDLSGCLKKWTANGVGSLSVTQRNLAAASKEKGDKNSGQIGKGILSLANDPVVCVATQDLMANNWGFNLYVNGEQSGTYSNPAFDDYNVRLITFLDPTSIKVNLNTDAYGGNVTDVKVYATTYVNPEATYGNTEAFRTMLGLSRPAVDISCDKNKGLINYSEFNHDLPIRLHRVRCTDLLNDLNNIEAERYPSESPANCEIVKQAGSDIRYYGRVCEIEGRKYIYQPQVFIPYNKKKNDTTCVVKDGILPDFIVAVTVSFKANGKPCYFTQHYLPKYELLDHDALLKRRDTLRQFTDNCKNGTSNFKLANKSNIPVIFPFGYSMTYKTLKMLNYIDK